jgi:type IV secretion system protein VirB10
MSDQQEPPPPPPPPPDEEGYQEEGYTPPPAEVPDALNEEEAFNEAAAAGPAVAASANKNMVLIVAGVAVGLFLLYQIFSGEEEVVAPQPAPPTISETGAPVANDGGVDLPSTTAFEPLPPPPPPPIRPDPEPLPTPAPPPPGPDIDFSGAGPSNEQLQARRASQMLIAGGGGGSNNNADPTRRPGVTTAAQRAIATKVGDLNTLVLQGKVIDAVLESALDTTLPGPLRAIVSHDVYAESGYDVLIPKGSRLIGTYNTDVVRGQGRVFIIWNRLIRPDGVDIQLNSQAVDKLGKSGITGFVDNRFFEVFSGAILTSIMSITIAGVADALLDPQATTTQQSTTVTGGGIDQAIQGAVGNINNASNRALNGLLDTRPNISVDQGTPMKVFVNQDLEFPNDQVSDIRIIQ